MQHWIRENYKKIIKAGQLFFYFCIFFGIIYSIVTKQYFLIAESIVAGIIGAYFWKPIVISVLKVNKIL